MSSWVVGIDIGGTFTDVVAIERTTGETRDLKVASSRTDPASAVLEGIRALRTEQAIEPSDIALLLHGTTLVTNAIIERDLAPTALVTTEGFRDVLEIGRTWRTELYDPFFDQPPALVDRALRFEVAERVGAKGELLTPLEPSEIDRVIGSLRETGVQAVAVTFLHSYRQPRHEAAMADALREVDGWYVCASSELLREVREYERTATTVLNAALMPLIDRYLSKLTANLHEVGAYASLFVSQSNGGAQTPQLARERPVTMALSGPVAGVVAELEIGRRLGMTELIGLDMGGTSTDVSLISEGRARVTTQLSVGDLPIRLPSVNIHAIGAGGGSIARVDPGGALHVGPDSAGSDPGPAAYGHGGQDATVTDSHLVLGRMSDDHKLAGRLQLDQRLAERALRERVADPLGIDVVEAAAGVVEVANAAMERAVRVVLRDRGDDPRDFALVAFGGAGPLHAAELARRLSISTVVVPARPGTLCANGLLHADIRLDFSMSELHRSDDDHLVATLVRIFGQLADQTNERFEAQQDLDLGELRLERSCELRYLGQAYEVQVPLADGPIDAESVSALITGFHERHQRAYAFSDPDDPIELVTYRVVGVLPIETASSQPSWPHQTPVPVGRRQVYELGTGFVEATVWERSRLPIAFELTGPAVILQSDTTTFLPSYGRVVVADGGDLLISIEEPLDGDGS